MSDTTTLIAQLRALLMLTQTEEQVARVRVTQARTDAVRRELQQNAAHAAERTTAINQQLRALAGIGDVVTPALGRLTALVKAALEQAGPVDEALLQDLQLEHQLLDRATYLKVLAQAADQPEVEALAERLITAHSATVEWLTVVLAEQALGGPAALRATPFQRVAGGATKLANRPVRFATDTVNRAMGTVQHGGGQGGGSFAGVMNDVVGRANAFTGAVRETFAAGRESSLSRAERGARREGDSADELPIPGYDSLTTDQAVAAVKRLDDPEDVRTVIRYEEAHQARASVVSATQARMAALAKRSLDIPD